MTEDQKRAYILVRHASHEACELKLIQAALSSAFEIVTPRMRRVS